MYRMRSLKALIGLLAALSSIVLLGCQKDDEATTTKRKLEITLTAPTVLKSPRLVHLEGKAGDVELTCQGEKLLAELAPGVYAVVIRATYYDSETGADVQTSYTGDLEVTNDQMPLQLSFTLQYTPSGGKDQLLITEIFYSGVDEKYIHDKYIRIANASKDKTLYLDGVLLLQSHFNTNSKKECTPPVPFAEQFVADVVYQFPGTGRDHPLKPGEEITICQSAVDHREGGLPSVDLSHADYQWVDAKNAFLFSNKPMPHNPAVPDMKPIYVHQDRPDLQGQGMWIIHNGGVQAFALARCKAGSLEEYVNDKDHFFNYTWKFVSPKLTTDMPCQYPPITIPNGWIEDAVVLGIKEKWAWTVLSPLLDAGFCGVTEKWNDAARFGKSVQRKKNADGSWIDTNNSTEDFMVAKPSLLP